MAARSGYADLVADAVRAQTTEWWNAMVVWRARIGCVLAAPIWVGWFAIDGHGDCGWAVCVCVCVCVCAW